MPLYEFITTITAEISDRQTELITAKINEVGKHRHIGITLSEKKVVELLQKQKPETTYVTNVLYTEDEYRFSVCPTCLGTIITESDMRPKVCTWCGQRLSI